MALTRAFLKSMNLTEEQVNAIVEEHTNVTGALKDQIKEYKDAAEKLPTLQKELDDLKKDVKANDWKGKYDKEHESFEKYKEDMHNKEVLENTKSAYRRLLADCNVGEKHIDAILKVTDFSDVKLKDDGTIDGVDTLKEKVKTDWSGFISTKETRGQNPETPPAGGSPASGSMGRAAQLAKKYHDNLYGVKEE